MIQEQEVSRPAGSAFKTPAVFHWFLLLKMEDCFGGPHLNPSLQANPLARIPCI